MILGSQIQVLSKATAEVDLFIHALGFEQRSTAVLSSVIDRSVKSISLLFPNETRLSFRANVALARDKDAIFVNEYVRYFREEFSSAIVGLHDDLRRPPKIAIDISSMNRTMMAEALFAIMRSRSHIGSVELMYVPGVFKQPKSEFPEIEQIGAVIPELSGFSADPELPIGVVMGLGYEYGLAVGLINRLEPRLTVCFRAVGYDLRYEEACRNANLDFDFGCANVELGSYPLVDAASAYRHLENVVFGMAKGFRVVVVPLGPKLFAALAILIAIKNVGTVAIWRVAAKLEVSDIQASDDLLRIDLDLRSELPKRELGLAAQLRA